MTKFTLLHHIAVAGLLAITSTHIAYAGILAETCPANPSFAGDDTQTLVTTANRLAEVEDRLGAICRYQVASQRLPNNETLRNNLAVLTFNHAMALTQTKQFTEARQWLLTSKKLSPSNPQSQHQTDEAIAITYIREANYRRDTDAVPDWPAYAQLFRQAISIQPEAPVYRQHLASLLTHWGNQLARQGKFDLAATKLTEAHQLDPEHPAIQRSLADVHLQQARQQPIGSDTQQQFLDQAVNLDPTLAEAAKQIKAGKAVLSEPNTALLNTPDASQTDSLPLTDKLAAIEDFLGLTPKPTVDMPHRLVTVEKALYGAKQKGGLVPRVNQAYHSLVGQGQTLEHSPAQLTVAVETVEGTYLYPILKNTGGRVVRWARFPLALNITVPEADNTFWQTAPLGHSETLAAIQGGIDRWVWGTDEFVSVVWVDDPVAADVVIRLQSDQPYVDRFANPETVDVLKEFTLPKASKLAKALGFASMFAPGYYGLAPRAGAAALQYKEAQKIQKVREESEIHLGKNVMATAEQLANATAYEFGHVLGLKAASPTTEDLLHPSTPMLAEGVKAISTQDKATLKALYQRPAAIILNLQ